MKMARLLIIGVGALGSSFLKDTTGRFSKVGIFDGDVISEKNLRTQPFYSVYNPKIPTSKAVFAAEKMRAVDDKTEYIPYSRYFTENDYNVLKGYDCIIDFTDNIKSRLLINKMAVKLSIPAVYGSINEREALLYFYSRNSACFNCIYRNSLQRIKEGCESLISPPDDKTIGFFTRNIYGFLEGRVKGGTAVAFNIQNKNEISVNIKRDVGCGCVNGSLDIDESKFIQTCASGIKFSYGRKIDIHKLRERAEHAVVIDNYLVYREKGRSFLVSHDGDFLFTGYNLGEVKELLSFLLE